VRGKGPVRTGVTAILPGYFAGNGNGDMTGTQFLYRQ
jgi:D-aminopeptidase